VSEKTRTRSLQAPRRVRAYLAANNERPVLLLASSEDDAERYARDAACFTREAVVHLPSRGVAYGDVFEPAVTRVGRRQRSLRSLSSARVVVAGPLAFMERTPLYEPLDLSGGVEMELDATLGRLVELGYERMDRVSRPGEFAVRSSTSSRARAARR
jgi:transcription-repair coupling factor (superfamily II helicase)